MTDWHLTGSVTDAEGVQLAMANLIDVFSERDHPARDKAMHKTFRPNITFYEPKGTVKGYDEVSARVDELLAMGDGTWVFEAAGLVQRTANMFVVAWKLGPPEGPDRKVEGKVTGLDVNLVEDGKIAVCYVTIDGASDLSV